MFARLACALLALSAAHAQYPDKCGNDLKGRKTPYAVQLLTTKMVPGVLGYNVYVTADNLAKACGYSNQAGLLVVACDYDYPPSVHVGQTLTDATVRRTGDLSQEGYIYTTVYCDGPARVGKGVQGSVVRVEPGHKAAPAPSSGDVGVPVYK